MDTREREEFDYWEEVWTKQGNHPAFSTRQFRPYLFGPLGLYTRMLRRHISTSKTVRVLELGAGGPNLRLLALRKYLGAEVTGIDYSPTALGQLRDIFALHDQALSDAILDDFFSHDFGATKFDLIVHWGLAEHYADPTALFARCKQLMSAAGEMLFTMPNMAGWGGKAWRRWRHDNWLKHHRHSSADLCRAFEQVGLRLQEEFFFGPPFISPEILEDDHLAARLSSLGQSFISKIPIMLPVFHRLGSEIWSLERGFHVVQSLPRESALQSP